MMTFLIISATVKTTACRPDAAVRCQKTQFGPKFCRCMATYRLLLRLRLRLRSVTSRLGHLFDGHVSERLRQRWRGLRRCRASFLSSNVGYWLRMRDMVPAVGMLGRGILEMWTVRQQEDRTERAGEPLTAMNSPILQEPTGRIARSWMVHPYSSFLGQPGISHGTPVKTRPANLLSSVNISMLTDPLHHRALSQLCRRRHDSRYGMDILQYRRYV